MKFELPKLPYAFDALEPYLDAETMEIHYTKHHQAYADKLNAVLEKYPDLQGQAVENLLIGLDKLPVSHEDKIKIKNQGGGYLNHNLYWEVMNPANRPDEKMQEEIKNVFGGVEEFKKKFSEAAVNHFASGWVWLVRDQNDMLQIYSLPNQDSPLALGHAPILLLDVWEHAYYLKYRNKRADFVEAWWKVIKTI